MIVPAQPNISYTAPMSCSTSLNKTIHILHRLSKWMQVGIYTHRIIVVVCSLCYGLRMFNLWMLISMLSYKQHKTDDFMHEDWLMYFMHLFTSTSKTSGLKSCELYRNKNFFCFCSLLKKSNIYLHVDAPTIIKNNRNCQHVQLCCNWIYIYIFVGL